MMSRSSRSIAWVLGGAFLLSGALLSVLPAAAQGGPTALDNYVNSPDPNYAFEVVDTITDEKATTHVVRMTSQAWLTEAQVDRPIWWHWLTIIEPNVPSVPSAGKSPNDVALLFIGGGSNGDTQPTQAEPMLMDIALATSSVIAELRMVPNQPLSFVGDEASPRKEDALIAYGWDQFLRGGARDHDALWLARLPMTKAAVRAMDTISAVTATLGGQNQRVRRFVVAGGSKRGWTTWTTAVVDDRVVAIVPFVIDMLNIVPSFSHHWQAYGFWSPAVADYKRQGIMEWQAREEYQRLSEITEPYSYRERLDLPKLLINASGDEFFLPDSWQFYWDGLIGEKHLRYVPNAGHGLDGSDVAASLGAFLHTVVQDQERPQYAWAVEGDTIEVTVDPGNPPKSVQLWQADNAKTRDFRIVRIKKTWQSSDLRPDADGTYRARVGVPAAGWRAFFVELTFDVGGHDLKVTSGVKVVPDTLPFDEYQPDQSKLP